MAPHLGPSYLPKQQSALTAVQLENELGFVNGPDNQAYLRHLYKVARSHLGQDVLIYTTDPPPNVAKGSLQGEEVYTCVLGHMHWMQLWSHDAIRQRELTSSLTTRRHLQLLFSCSRQHCCAGLWWPEHAATN